MYAYEAVIRQIEQQEVSDETDRLLAALGAELLEPAPGRPALMQAVAYLAPRTSVDPTLDGRMVRLVQRLALSATVLDDWIERIARVMHSEDALIAVA